MRAQKRNYEIAAHMSYMQPILTMNINYKNCINTKTVFE